jgi:AbrB family looped-hinge helix DNA binding protein
VSATVTLDKAGRLVLPKQIREALRIGPGDSLEIESTEDRIILSPVRVRPGLQKEDGVWVFHSGKPASVSIPDLIDQERERRTRDLTTKRS